MSVQIHITVYKDAEDKDRFKVMAPIDDEFVDVTDDYEVTACATEDGRTGFMCVAKAKVGS